VLSPAPAQRNWSALIARASSFSTDWMRQRSAPTITAAAPGLTTPPSAESRIVDADSSPKHAPDSVRRYASAGDVQTTTCPGSGASQSVTLEELNACTLPRA